MDKWEFYPIKALSMAPLIMVTFRQCLPSTLGRRGRASTSSSACGHLLGLDESFSRMISSIISRSNLFTLWTTSQVYNSISSEWRHPQQLRLEASSRSRNGGWTDARMGWVGQPGPTSARFSRPFLCVCPLIILDLIPLIVSFWRCYPHDQDRGSSRMKSDLYNLVIGDDPS
jgi:hypothetical protein